MAARRFREGDRVTIRVRVVRVSDDDEQVTLEVGGQRITFLREYLEPILVKHEKGTNWPEGGA